MPSSFGWYFLFFFFLLRWEWFKQEAFKLFWFSCRTDFLNFFFFFYFIWLCQVLVAAFGTKFYDQDGNLGLLHLRVQSLSP